MSKQGKIGGTVEGINCLLSEGPHISSLSGFAFIFSCSLFFFITNTAAGGQLTLSFPSQRASSSPEGSLEIGPYFNCALVNVHIISHTGFDGGETPGGSLIVRGVISCGNGFWGLIAMAISPLPLGLRDLSQR